MDAPFGLLACLVGHGHGGQQILGVLRHGGRDVQSHAEAGEAVDDLSGASLLVVVFETWDPVSRQQGDGHVCVGRGIEGVGKQDCLLPLNKKRLIYFIKPVKPFLDLGRIKKILYIGIPNGVENGIFQFGRILVVSIISGFGTVQIAANAVANNIAEWRPYRDLQ